MKIRLFVGQDGDIKAAYSNGQECLDIDVVDYRRKRTLTETQKKQLRFDVTGRKYRTYPIVQMTGVKIQKIKRIKPRFQMTD